MKLLHKTGRYYFFFSTLVFLLGAIFLFIALRFYLNAEIDDRLQETRKILNKQLVELDSLPQSMTILDKIIEIHPANDKGEIHVFADTLFWSARDEEFEPYRKLTYQQGIHGNTYRVSINHSKLDNEELLATIVIIVLILLGFLLLMVNLFNRYLALRIWKPFYQTIDRIRNFTFDQGEPMVGLSTDIDEFKILNENLEIMTSKILNDYQSLKQFTENASHEIQTPLAIIRSKIELLFQKDEMSEDERRAILDIQRATTKLSKLNASLLLLTRIENRQYSDTQAVDLKELINGKIEQLEVLISSRNIAIETSLEEVLKKMDPVLADVLISNLLSNAIKHNISDGSIRIFLDKDKLKIQNSGPLLSKSTEQLFDRFKKASNNSNSLGLGLAIVKEICSNYNFRVEYQIENKWHTVIVYFKD